MRQDDLEAIQRRAEFTHRVAVVLAVATVTAILLVQVLLMVRIGQVVDRNHELGDENKALNKELLVMQQQKTCDVNRGAK